MQWQGGRVRRCLPSSHARTSRLQAALTFIKAEPEEDRPALMPSPENKASSVGGHLELPPVVTSYILHPRSWRLPLHPYFLQRALRTEQGGSLARSFPTTRTKAHRGSPLLKDHRWRAVGQLAAKVAITCMARFDEDSEYTHAQMPRFRAYDDRVETVLKWPKDLFVHLCYGLGKWKRWLLQPHSCREVLHNGGFPQEGHVGNDMKLKLGRILATLKKDNIYYSKARLGEGKASPG
ncbi:hypothetical protein TREES_T100005417 [Tupaia chinensis]|uniref:Uncharacterized protein n=1 Tax=Tupaia chinensis TaxID=246437 RepID=L9KQP0_TUPCH|nr:hypothetical protein TREES_T100005417 [Tupaia chinensis]